MLTLWTTWGATAYALHQPASRAAVVPVRRCLVPVAKAGDNDQTTGAVGGAVLGGLLAGPFGAIWGASLGGSIGAQRGAQKAEEERLEKMGLSREVRAAAAECAKDLSEAAEGLAACEQALGSAKALEAQLEASAAQAYSAAETALRAGDEAEARACLERRNQIKSQIIKAQSEVADAAGRVTRMEGAMSALTARSREIDAALQRSMAVSASSATSQRVSALELEDDDPLLRKFRDLERE